MQALERAYSASGLLGSGRHLKDAGRFVTGLADQDYGNYFNRLRSLSGGPQAAQAGGGVLSTGANLASTTLAGGQARADGLITAGQARASGVLGANQARGDGIATAGRLLGGFL